MYGRSQTDIRMSKVNRIPRINLLLFIQSNFKTADFFGQILFFSIPFNSFSILLTVVFVSPIENSTGNAGEMVQ